MLNSKIIEKYLRFNLKNILKAKGDPQAQWPEQVFPRFYTTLLQLEADIQAQNMK